MSEHERQAEKLEDELDDMDERVEKLEGDIDDAREDWERKKKDSSVPGAAGAPERADDDDAPEATYPSKQ